MSDVNWRWKKMIQQHRSSHIIMIIKRVSMISAGASICCCLSSPFQRCIGPFMIHITDTQTCVLVSHVNYSPAVLQMEVEGSSALSTWQRPSCLCLKASASLLIGEWKSGQAAHSWGKLSALLSPTVKTAFRTMTKAKKEPAKLECLGCNPKRLSC